MTAAAWAAELIERGTRAGDIPLYGSPEWSALPPDDPRRVAACVRAAERWRLDGTDEALRERLRAELDEADLYTRYRVSEASRDVCAAWRDLPIDPARLLPMAELRRRRAELLERE